MRTTPAALAMRRFVAAAIHAAGKQEAVASLLAREGVVSPRTGKPYVQTGISGWRTGHTRDVPAEPLFALAMSLGLSIDRFTLGEQYADGEVARRVAILWESEQSRREEEGRPPLDDPGQAEPVQG